MTVEEFIEVATKAAGKLPPNKLKLLADVVDGLVKGNSADVERRLDRLSKKLALASASPAKQKAKAGESTEKFCDRSRISQRERS